MVGMWVKEKERKNNKDNRNLKINRTKRMRYREEEVRKRQNREIMVQERAVCKSRCKGEESEVWEEGMWVKEIKKIQIDKSNSEI
jgi:hypothetical protein